MASKGSVEQSCMFHEEGMCHLHQGYISKCSLCFNFSSVFKPGDKGKTKSVYNIFDYLSAKGNPDVLFPKDNSVQTTL